MAPKKPKGPSKAELMRKLMEMEAQLASSYHFAGAALDRVAYPKLMASGVIMKLTILGQDKTVPPVLIRGGLSPHTIQAIKDDLARSYDEAIEFVPVK